MARNFDVGRQGEQLLNSDVYKQYLILKHLLDIAPDPSIGPPGELEGSLWIDRQSAGGDNLKFLQDGQWKSFFDYKFRMITEILNKNEPVDPVDGQFWLDNGVLKVFNGVEFIPVKAVNVDANFDLAAFEQFLLINPLYVSGENIVDNFTSEIQAGNVQNWTANTVYAVNKTVFYNSKIYKCITAHTSSATFDATKWEEVQLKSQFLMPSTELDKFFINGFYNDDYEVLNNVAIQYPTELLQGKAASAVHVNPNKLIDITKRIFKVNKANPVIAIQEQNTEFYGVVNGLGKLLLKTNDSNTEYTSAYTGIKLSDAAAQLYDFVYAVTYKFANTRNKGNLKRGKTTINGSSSIFVDAITQPFLVFAGGFFLDDNASNYTYNLSTGYLNLNFDKGSSLDIAVMVFPKKETGTIATVDASGGKIVLTSTFTRPLVFVGGPNVDSALADYTYNAATKTITVLNAQVGMTYAVVESLGANPEDKMFVKAGTVPAAVAGVVSIPVSLTEIPSDIEPLLFVDGIYVSQKDIVRNSDNSISAYGLSSGQEYVLLKDPGSRLVFDDAVNYTTIPTAQMDAAVVYVENSILCDTSAAYVASLPKFGAPGEIKLLINGTSEKWHSYDEAIRQWVEITDDALIATIEDTVQGYTTSKKSISLLQDFDGKNCSYLAYTFANSIEQPLLRDSLITNSIDTNYKINFKHSYTPGTNSLAVWLDGVRQYYISEVNNATFALPKAVAGNAFYVIEKPEKSEIKSCEREILTKDNRILGTANAYETAIPLYPGNLRVYVSGYRQPASAYRVVDAYTIMFKDTLIGGIDNFPIEMVEKEDGALVPANHTIADEIMIEVRQDYSLKEITLPVRYPGQREWNVYEDNLPKEILESTDFIMIYLNGAAYGKQYIVDKDKEAIILSNEEVTDTLGTDPIYQYFQQNPAEYMQWRKANGDKVYTPKTIKDTITFEWR